MRNTVGHILLAIFVVTLAISNVLMANKLLDAGNEQARLSFRLNKSSATQKSKIVLKKLNPESGSVGTLVTVQGSGFARTGNTVFFDYHEIQAVSKDSKTLTFVVPKYIHFPCPSLEACPTNDWQAVVPRTYQVVVGNSHEKSNPLKFIVK